MSDFRGTSSASGGGSVVYGHLVVNVSSYDQANNRALVSVRLYIQSDGDSVSWGSGGMGANYNVGGQTWSGTWSGTLPAGGTVDINTGSYYIPLNDNGTDKIISCAANVSIPGVYSSVSMSGSLNLGHLDLATAYFYDSGGYRVKAKEVYFYDSGGYRIKAKEVYFYDSAGNRHKARS